MTQNDAAQWRFETTQIHAGAQPDPTTGARATPIYKTTSYVFANSDEARDLFALAKPGNIYSRIMNPTNDVVEQRIAALEGGSGALLVSSGQAAETYAVLNIAGAGDHIVSSSSIYGGTYNLFKYTLAKLGIETTFVEDQDDLDEWRRAFRPNTKLFFAETIGNPKINVLDITGVSEVAHESGVPLIVDKHDRDPYLIRPFEHGADIVVHSATKFLGGHGTVIGGIIVDSGKFAWSQHPDKFRSSTPPTPRTTARSSPRPSATSSPTSSRPGCSCSATSVRRTRRTPRSRCCRASRRCRSGSSGTCRTRRRSRSGSTGTRTSRPSPTPGCRRRPGTPRRTATRRRASERCCRSS